MYSSTPPSLLTAEQAIFVLVILFLIPVAVLVLDIDSFRKIMMLFDALGLGFLWNRMQDDDTLNNDKGRGRRKKLVRSRADQASIVNEASLKTAKYYPGLVNISGTYCFLNSTLQAMASLSYLQPYLDDVYRRAEYVDVPTPVLDALVDIMHALNQPSSRSTSHRPTKIIHALSTPVPGFKRGTLFASREHQDAQELFQLITETLKEEALEVDKEAGRDRGLGTLGTANHIYIHRPAKEPGKGVFEGLTANRRSCVVCGYTEAVMHFAFDNLQLTVPRVAQCSLENCLEEYTKMELLNDCICRKCSMFATLRKLEADAIRVSAAHDGPETASRKRRIAHARKLVKRVKTALEEGRIEDDIKGVTLEKVVSRQSTRQTMLARTPPVLALHLNRSAYYGHYAAKNSCSVTFPEILDLTPYTTSGALSTAPQSPISKPSPALPPRSSTPTPSLYSTPRTLYRLTSVVCHYGAHSFGHYVAYRRKPRDPSLQSSRWAPPRLQCPYGCECDNCQLYGPIRDPDFTDMSGGKKGKGRPIEDGWLRVSDDQVREVGLNSVLAETTGSFMLYYEKVLPFQGDSVRTSPRSSQETVTPHAQEEKRIMLEELMEPFRARIVRSVSVGTPSREGSLVNGNANGDWKGDRERKMDVDPPEEQANGHADPNESRGRRSPSKALDTRPNGSPERCIPLSSSPVRATHHMPRDPSPVRAVEMKA